MAASDLAAGAVAGTVGGTASNPAVRLAVAVLLFWIAGFLLFIAFGKGATYLQSFAKGGGLGALRQAFQAMFGRAKQVVPQQQGEALA